VGVFGASHRRRTSKRLYQVIAQLTEFLQMAPGPKIRAPLWGYRVKIAATGRESGRCSLCEINGKRLLSDPESANIRAKKLPVWKTARRFGIAFNDKWMIEGRSTE
jgi:hypothetical protein